MKTVKVLNPKQGFFRISWFIPALSLSFVLAMPCIASAQKKILVENEFLRIGLRIGHETAYIEEFTSKSQGRNLVVPVVVTSPVPIFQIDIYQGAKPITLVPKQADKLELSQTDSETIELRADFRMYGLTVRQKLRLKSGSPTASFSINFNLLKPGYRVGIVRMPGLGLLLETGSKTAILLPIADGALLNNPAVTLKDGEKRSFNYPGLASAQMMAAYDSRGGMVFYAADGRGEFKTLTARRYGKQLVLAIECVLYHKDPPNIELPYSIEVGTFEGSWERAADIYKLWARKQTWCRTLLKDRKLPASLSDASFTLGLNLRGEKGDNRILQVPKIAKSWLDSLVMPINVLLGSWEKSGAWIAPDYFPPFGGEPTFRKMLDTLRLHGQRSFAFLSGFNVTLDKTVRPGVAAFKISQSRNASLEKAAIVGPDGKPLRQGRAEEGTGRHSILCPSTKLARQTVREGFTKLRSYGVNWVQIDQVVGGGTPPCFSDQHGHAVVGGHSMFDATASLFDSITAADPTAVISLEEPGELFIPHVHIFHARDYMEGFWPRDGTGITGVSLFNYLYHEYSLGYGGDSAPISQKGDEPTLAIYAQAMNLINGRLPAAASWTKIISFDQVHADQRRFMKDVATLWKGPVSKFLRLGILLPLDHQVSTKFNLRGTESGKDFDIVTGTLLGCGYRTMDGKIGIAYINISKKVIQEKLDFASERTGIPKNTKVVWPVAAEPGSKGIVALTKTIKSGESYTFPPFGILFLEGIP
jgi:Domain of unknown function (DUF6259)